MAASFSSEPPPLAPRRAPRYPLHPWQWGGGMLIGILETGEVNAELAGKHGAYPPMFARLFAAIDPRLRFLTVPVVRGAMPTGPAQADAWVVTGSRHGVYDDIPWVEPLKAFLRACVDARVPVAGICFGHQILAEAMGGRVEKSAKGWGLGVQRYRIDAAPAWFDGPADYAGMAIHQDQVVQKPDGATVIASSAFCEYAALAYGDPDRPVAVSVQSHPEFTAAFVEDLIAARSGVFPPDRADAALATLDRPLDNAAWARGILAVFRAAEAARTA